MTTTKLINGELVTDAKPHIRPLPCDVPGVTAIQTSRKWQSCKIEERLYKCQNGLALGARRGGPLHLADASKGTWEIFVLNPMGFANGAAVGWIDEAQLGRLVVKLAEFDSELADAS